VLKSFCRGVFVEEFFVEDVVVVDEIREEWGPGEGLV